MGLRIYILHFRLDACDRNGTEMGEKKMSVTTMQFACFGRTGETSSRDVSFRVRCTLFTVLPFFSLSPNDETRKTNSASERNDRQIVRIRCRIPRIYRPAISIIARAPRWRRLSGERDFPSGGDTVSPLFFLSYLPSFPFAMIDEDDFPFRDRSRLIIEFSAICSLSLSVDSPIIHANN